MTFQDLRNDGFTVMKHENINIMATEFHIQKGNWNYKQIIPYELILRLSVQDHLRRVICTM